MPAFMKFDSEGVKRYINGVIATFTKSGLEELGETVDTIQKEMQQPGAPVTYPIEWDSERQRRAFFATDGFGKGIPYVRKGLYTQGYQKAALPDGYSLTNKEPGAAAVGGHLKGNSLFNATAKQSKIHAKRWKNILPNVIQAVSNISRRVIDRVNIILGKG